ncbi:hypothetical protein EE612_035433 [Oryza sativa]|nr:hypothetical protein EE612_035433 [Oryza sativa]
MRKDAAAGGGGGGGIAAGPAPALLCFDLKPFLAALTVLTLAVRTVASSGNASVSSDPGGPPASLPEVGNKKPVAAAAAADPNRREFRAVGSAAALFVQMGAYRGGPYTFAVIGLASKPTHVYGKPWFRCEWVPNANGSAAAAAARPMRAANTYHMLPDWGYGRVYTVVVVNCTFARVPNADNAGGKLVLNAYYGASPARYERIVAMEEAPGAYDAAEFRPPHRYDYLYCGSSLYGNLSAARVREWMAYHARFFGLRSHFVFHDAGGVSSRRARRAGAVGARRPRHAAGRARPGRVRRLVLQPVPRRQRLPAPVQARRQVDLLLRRRRVHLLARRALARGRPRRARALHAVHHRAEPHVEQVMCTEPRRTGDGLLK